MSFLSDNLPSQRSCSREFFIRAAGRYTIGKNIIDRLRALGPPPRIPSGSSYPSRTVDQVLEILGAIAANIKEVDGPTGCLKAQSLVEANWTSTFAAWVKYFLQDVILAADCPSDLPGVDRLDYALLYIPGFLSFRRKDEGGSSIMATIHRISPEIPRLAIEAWAKVLGDHHTTWGEWTFLIRRIMDSVVKSESWANCPDIRSSGICAGNHQIGLAFVSHINHQTGQMAKMSPMEMQVFKLTLEIMSKDTFTNDCPLYLESLRQYSLPAVIKLLSSALRKPRDTSLESEEASQMSFTETECAYDIGIYALAFLAHMVDDAYSATEALRHGLVNVVFNVHPVFFDRRIQKRDVALYDVVPPILLRISRLLMYRSVLHQFSRVERKICASGELEERLKSNSKELYKSWERVKENASFIRTVRRGGKENGTLRLCSSVQCPQIHTEVDETRKINIHYFRCAACSSVMYCSRSCQKFDWKNGHREQCSRQAVETRPYCMTLREYDYRFFQFWMQNFTGTCHKYIEDSITKYLAELTSRSQSQPQSPECEGQAEAITTDQQMILDGLKHPIISMDFSGPDSFPFPEDCLEIHDTTTICTFEEDSLSPETLEMILFEWQRSYTDNILAVAIFPKQFGALWTIAMFLEFPLRFSGSEDGDRDQGSGSGD
ncbi:hypothetical protein L218DRAFT_1079455 [Marasmius fiardii PR-910]|nr:hypothetical protein L218DRAFT_1079455 [Marasmius fiardii PR-910]